MSDLMNPKDTEVHLRSSGDRQMLMKNIFIDHDRFSETYNFIKRTHYPVEGGNPDYGSLAVIAGESRAGKSYAAKRYVKRFAVQVGETGLICPVVYVDLPVDGQRALLEALADAVGIKFSCRDNSPGLATKILNGLIHKKVELIILDEVNTIVHDKNKRNISSALTFFRKILNHCKLNMICIGLEETYDLLAVDPQLTGRGGLPCHIVHPYSWDNSEERGLFRLLCGEFDKRMPFAQSSGLESEWFAHRLYYSSKEGNIGRLKDFLYSAGCRAINDGAETIEVRHFAEAYEAIKGRDVEFNPWKHDLAKAPVGKSVAVKDAHGRVRVSAATFSKKARTLHGT